MGFSVKPFIAMRSLNPKFPNALTAMASPSLIQCHRVSDLELQKKAAISFTKKYLVGLTTGITCSDYKHSVYRCNY